MGHDHGSSAASHKGRLTAVLALSVTILVVEVIGSVVTNSVALLADAGHVLTDVVGIALRLRPSGSHSALPRAPAPSAIPASRSWPP